MRQRSLFVLLIIFFAATGAAAQGSRRSRALRAEPKVEWRFDTREDRDNNPNTRVFLIVNGRRFFVMRDVAQFSTLNRKDYSAHDVPANALIACVAWWAGSGEEMYVIRRGRQLIVYIRYLDEQTELGRYKRLKTIPLS
jgi:hypothetical protein